MVTYYNRKDLVDFANYAAIKSIKHWKKLDTKQKILTGVDMILMDESGSKYYFGKFKMNYDSANMDRLQFVTDSGDSIGFVNSSYVQLDSVRFVKHADIENWKNQKVLSKLNKTGLED